MVFLIKNFLFFAVFFFSSVLLITHNLVNAESLTRTGVLILGSCQLVLLLLVLLYGLIRCRQLPYSFVVSFHVINLLKQPFD